MLSSCVGVEFLCDVPRVFGSWRPDFVVSGFWWISGLALWVISRLILCLLVIVPEFVCFRGLGCLNVIYLLWGFGD